MDLILREGAGTLLIFEIVEAAFVAFDRCGKGLDHRKDFVEALVSLFCVCAQEGFSLAMHADQKLDTLGQRFVAFGEPVQTFVYGPVLIVAL